MAVWAPVNASTDIRKILGNLVTFFEANQVAALAWASPSRTLPSLTFYKTAEVRMKTDFPHFGVVKRRTVTDDGDAGLQIQYTLTFEMEIAANHTEATRTNALNQLQLDTDNYTYAVESMYLNITKAALMANVTGAGNLYKSVTSSDPLEVAVSNTQSLMNVQMTAILEFREMPQ